jgi:Ca2+/H+ antiporter, TMEM165/GDT1 family
MIDRAVVLTAFASLFVAEMGDKTQLAVLTLTASSRKPASVFLGAVLALAAVTAVGVLVGEGVGRAIPEAYLKKAASLLFVGIGVWMWVKP